MKNCFVLFSLLVGISGFSQKEIFLTGKTKSATVYLNGAQVNKSITCTVPKGKSTIVIQQITPLLVEESIQVKGEGDFTILSVNQQLVYKEIEKEKTSVEKLTQQQEQLTIDIENETALLQALKEQEQLFNANKTIIDNNNSLKAEELRAMLELHASNIKEAKLEMLTHSRKIQRLREQLNSVKGRMNALQLIEEEVTREIRVEIVSKKETKASFEVSYLVPNAKWYPSYDVIAQKVDQPIQLKYYANISQQTGEDWDDIKITLSTSDPNQNATKPTLTPWRLRLNQNTVPSYATSKKDSYNRLAKFSKVSGVVRDAKTNEPLPFVNVLVVNSSIGATTDFDGRFSLTLPPEARQLKVNFVGYEEQVVNITSDNIDIGLKEAAMVLDEVMIVSTKEKLIDPEVVSVTTINADRMPGRSAGSFETTRVKSYRSKRNRNAKREKVAPIKITPVKNVVNKQFKIESPVEVPSSIKSYKIEIKELAINAGFEHFCIPKVEPSVFLTATITDWEQYDLLEGQTNIYFEDTYTGNTLLDVGYLSDTLVMSLGIDKDVQVKRQKQKDYTKRQILGGNKSETRAFTIEARNGKDSPIRLVVQDQIPVSTNNKIEIDHDISDNPKIEESTGIVTWDLNLTPKENKKLLLEYKISYPKESWIAVD